MILGVFNLVVFTVGFIFLVLGTCEVRNRCED